MRHKMGYKMDIFWLCSIKLVKIFVEIVKLDVIQTYRKIKATFVHKNTQYTCKT